MSVLKKFKKDLDYSHLMTLEVDTVRFSVHKEIYKNALASDDPNLHELIEEQYKMWRYMDKKIKEVLGDKVEVIRGEVQPVYEITHGSVMDGMNKAHWAILSVPTNRPVPAKPHLSVLATAEFRNIGIWATHGVPWPDEFLIGKPKAAPYTPKEWSNIIRRAARKASGMLNLETYKDYTRSLLKAIEDLTELE